MDKHVYVLRDNGDVLKINIGDMVEIVRSGFSHWGIYIGMYPYPLSIVEYLYSWHFFTFHSNTVFNKLFPVNEI